MASTNSDDQQAANTSLVTTIRGVVMRRDRHAALVAECERTGNTVALRALELKQLPPDGGGIDDHPPQRELAYHERMPQRAFLRGSGRRR